MPRFKSKMLWMVIPFLILLLFEMYPRRPSSQASQTKLSLGPCRGELVKDTITALKHNKTFVVSLYHDDRQQNLTRAIAVVHYKKIQDLYCWFCCSHDNRISIIRASVDIHPERFGLPVGAADIVCLEPQRCLPQYMSIHPSTRGSMAELPWFEINNRVSRTWFVREYTVCLSVMPENYDNVLQFVQSVEMYKTLGAKKVFIYKMSCTSLMDRILNFYVQEGTVEIILWPITSYVRLSSFWYSYQDWGYGKTTILNDCIYRNMYRSKYVVFNDINEIILPLKHPNWKGMIDSLEDQHPGVGIFFFESHFFSQNVFLSLDKFNVTLWEAIPGVNVLQHVYREPNKLHINILKKMIVNPRSVVQASSHSILKGYGRTLEVSRDVAILYNCRRHLENEFGEQYLMRDTTIWRFNVSLISNVNQVFDQVLGKRVDSIPKAIWSMFWESLGKIF
ncbi:uncharacterized protein LOC107291048 [Protobothrops mucrosquamatus]|uniref:uncharacterized protein LOC107291048 n=1 Tax=Protobothrops mucrosquamatus TaxID=103944 RepID=UPI0007757FEF|nr:uncharacterized protein LOC107291048 [Protobothrops mucrosquamatus]